MGNTLYYKGIQLPQLRGFCTLATHGSFTAAAKALGLSKPTVWQQVRSLERELSVSLLRQGKQGVELTAEGHLLFKLIQPHITGLDSLVRVFETQRGELQQWLTVASTPYLILHRLPPVIQEFAATFPAVRLHLQTDPWTDGVLDLVDQRRVDVGIVPFDPAEQRNANLEYEPLFELTFTLLTSAQHPLARKKQVGPADIVRHPIIKGAAYNQRALEEVLRRHDLLDRLHVVMESGSTDIIMKYVALGIGLAVIYVDPRDPLPAPVRGRPFDPVDTGNLVVVLVHRKGAHLPEHVAALCEITRRHLAQDRPASRNPH